MPEQEKNTSPSQSQEFTAADLFKMLTKQYSQEPEENKRKDLKYVMYVRKSTDDKEKQIRSLSDQILECKEFAKRYDFFIQDIIKESESAKEPDIRPKFSKMITDIKAGKYDGIIAWHPDRLARNMKEAGEIIDLLDKDIIRDLKFVSFQFSNDSSGKMLLGISFVMSKQYSDQLGDNVKRSIKRCIEEGKYINSAKHGYIKDRDQFLRPDGKNFTLIKEAFQKRIQGETLDTICDYLNSNGYSRARKMGGKHEIVKIDKKRLSEVLRDTIYAGVVIYGGHIANLMEKYDFVPAITVDEYFRINKLSELKKTMRLIRNARGDESVKANLMRGCVFCGKCNSPMISGITTKKSKKGITRYYYYRCENKKCETKSVRAHVVVNFVYDFLENTPFSNRKAYEHYKKEMGRVIRKRDDDMRKEKIKLVKERTQKERQLKRIKELMLEEEDIVIRDSFKNEIREYENRLKEIRKKLSEIDEALSSGKQGMKSYSEYLELMQNLAKSIRKVKTMKDLDFIIRKVFLNFTLEDQKVAKYTLNSPFRELVKSGIVRDSRSERT